MENPQHIKQLYEKYLNNDFSEQELDELLEYFYNSGEHHGLSDMIMSELANEESEYRSHAAVQALLANLDRDLFVEIEKRRTPVKTVRLWPRVAVAAAAVAAITFGVWFYTSRQSRLDVGNPGSAQYATDIAPGKNGATITLANGKVIQLSDAKSGVVIGDGDLKYSDGAAVQGDESRSKSGDVVEMTAATARGQTYQFTLPDGTKVWLNADSKISFPSQFNGKERKILLTGEAYFAVKHNAKQPFKVESKGQVVEDIGTEFNINAYSDETVVRTTLVEGSASVNETVLVPNQQASLKDGQIKVRSVDPEEAVSWKSGVFLFADEPLESIMRKVARWYDVEVIYNSENLRTETFKGSVSRYDKVSRILKTLEFAGAVKFKIEGNKITVMK